MGSGSIRSPVTGCRDAFADGAGARSRQAPSVDSGQVSGEVGGVRRGNGSGVRGQVGVHLEDRGQAAGAPEAARVRHGDAADASALPSRCGAGADQGCGAGQGGESASVQDPHAGSDLAEGRWAVVLQRVTADDDHAALGRGRWGPMASAAPCSDRVCICAASCAASTAAFDRIRAGADRAAPQPPCRGP